MTMHDDLTRLLAEMSELLESRELGTVDLYLIGGSSLVLFEGRVGATKDLDVVHDRLRNSNAKAAEVLISTFGKASGRSPYLDLVPGGLPPLPLGWAGRAVRRDSASTSLRLWSMDPADMVISKLRRWIPRDRADVRFICDRHPDIRDRLSAFSEADFFEVDWWDEMKPRRDRVLDYLDGLIEEL